MGGTSRAACMSYRSALERAGATVDAFERFGTYQGDWYAHVTLPDGRIGWIIGSFGSCPTCDAFEREFGDRPGMCVEHYYMLGERAGGCDACLDAEAAHHNKLVAFGERCFEDLVSDAEAEQIAARDVEWDLDALKVVEFVRAVNASHASGKEQTPKPIRGMDL